MVRVASEQRQHLAPLPAMSLSDQNDVDDIKSRLADEISSILQRTFPSSTSSCCAATGNARHHHRHSHHHRHHHTTTSDGSNKGNYHHHHRHSSKSTFVDWYLVLKVEEDANAGIIRKQYHKLALLLHPDKNHHPKAEIAFKLVSQAYACLSDETRRRAFNIERQSRRRKTSSTSSCCNNHHKPKCTSPADKIHYHYQPADVCPGSYTILQQQLKEIKKKMEEEARVIENCLDINRIFKSRNDYPVFSPSNYQQFGYPHRPLYKQHCCRPAEGKEDDENERRISGRSVLGFSSRRLRCETPVFELNRRSSECIPLTSKAATCLSS